ncbi:4-hydroxy-tetrahydrodipicolinate reductase [Candidatus Acetothermia bacterium]|nr:4-hydroxy-tetrahydrodipicolinate reductase [Candidatus Acetothermia bacterium]
MRIGLIGHGKMGQEIERLATQKKHTITHIFTEDKPLWNAKELSDIDVLIDFSLPSAVMKNIETAARAKANLVEGTTGWYEKLSEVQRQVQQSGIGFIYASNFSLGVNLFFKIVEHAGSLFNHFSDYDLFVHEMHHNQKIDSPSGTALSLGKILLKTVERKKEILSDRAASKIEPSQLHISSTRVGSMPGTHIVGFDSAADTIELTHKARNRSGFALGALAAAEWIQSKKGFFIMDEMIKDILRLSKEG